MSNDPGRKGVEQWATNLNNLTDVDAPDPADGDALVFDAEAGLWKPGPAQSGATVADRPAEFGIRRSTSPGLEAIGRVWLPAAPSEDTPQLVGSATIAPMLLGPGGHLDFRAMDIDNFDSAPYDALAFVALGWDLYVSNADGTEVLYLTIQGVDPVIVDGQLSLLDLATWDVTEFAGTDLVVGESSVTSTAGGAFGSILSARLRFSD